MHLPSLSVEQGNSLHEEPSVAVSPSSTCAVVVSWNSAGQIRGCLASLSVAERRPGIVVVDNASADGTCDVVRREFPDAVLLANAGNPGFAAATNQGVRAALARGSERILLLNPDAEIGLAALCELERSLDANPELGLVAPAIVTGDGAPQAFAFGGDPSLRYLLRRGAGRLLRRPPLHDWGSPTEIAPDWVTGACILARAEVFRRGVWFDEEYFLYFEDNDWCLRVRQAGWSIRRVPTVSALHLGGCSLRQNATARGAYARSLRRFYARHYPRWHGWVLRALWPLYERAVSC